MSSSAQDSQTKALIKNIAAQKWHKFLTIFKPSGHFCLISYQRTLTSTWNRKICWNCKIQMSRWLLMEDVRIYCSVWFFCMLGASDLSQEDLMWRCEAFTLMTATIAVHNRMSKMFQRHFKNLFQSFGVFMSPICQFTGSWQVPIS